MRRKVASIALTALLLPSCSVWFFSGERHSWVDRTRPVALLETTGGVELAATTEFGVLSLGRTATDGPCRIHYFLGPTPLIETGKIQPTGSMFAEAVLDLKTQAARILDRQPDEYDEFYVMWTPNGTTVETVSVERVSGEGLNGDLLQDPGVELPAGATLLCRDIHGKILFAGLIAGRANVTGGAAAGTYYVYAGTDRVRELLAIPQQFPVDEVPHYRPDGITTMRAIPPGGEAAATPDAAAAGAPEGREPEGGGGQR
ncbi:MAG: hypothetical protein AB8H80_04790 [Planctomycetota bacterium]